MEIFLKPLLCSFFNYMMLLNHFFHKYFKPLQYQLYVPIGKAQVIAMLLYLLTITTYTFVEFYHLQGSSKNLYWAVVNFFKSYKCCGMTLVALSRIREIKHLLLKPCLLKWLLKLNQPNSPHLI